MTETKHEHGFLSNMSPKGAFFLGLGSALVLFFVVGFFVLLGVVLKGKEGGLLAGKGNAPLAPSAPNAPSAPSAADQGVSAEGMKPITDEDWVKGDRGAKVTIVEYSDLECPFCQRHHPTLQQLVAQYGGQVNWVFRHFPLANLHPNAPKEAEAAECAGELGGNDAFWKFVDRINEVKPATGGLDQAELPKIAEYAGVNASQFNECLSSGRMAGKVQAQYQDASAAGGTGTPYNVIVSGDQKIPISGAVPIESFKQVIDPLL
jgi:protein-disulfide isomerase